MRHFGGLAKLLLRSLIIYIGIHMMPKSIRGAIVAATAIAAPVSSFAQSSQPVTRANVRADLVRAEEELYS
jgi:hypothetical protein